MKISELFSKDIHRPVEEVIKVDDLDDQILVDEIREYHPTASIQAQMKEVLEAYSELRRQPTADVGVWISGFFGAGKSSFAKLLGLLLGNRPIGDSTASELFAERITNQEIKVLLKQIQEHLPTHVVIFDILKDNIAGAVEHPVTTVMYKALLRSLGYAYQELDLAALEMQLEDRGELDAFTKAYEKLHKRQWDVDKAHAMLAINAASAALHNLDPATYPAADSWARSRPRDTITPRLLAERALQMAAARANGAKLLFVVDEMGQYTARDLRRIGDLQGVIESFSQVGRGDLWLVATSQERLQDVIDIYDRDRTELARLQDRFAYKVMLDPSDIREVASHRMLAKNAAAEEPLRELYRSHHNRLKAATQLTPLGGAQLPALEEDTFVQLYPLLPYQVDLLIGVVNGLRRQGGGGQTMGGANRTIITLTQQLLIHDKVGLADAEVGRLATFDGVYDLIVTNISSEIQQEVEDISRRIEHPFAVPVAKALVLLQFADMVQVTEESLAAVLHPAVDAEPVLPQVREAVELLLDARKIRRTESGLKLQSAAERSWDEERDSRRPTGGDRVAILKKALKEMWGTGAQQPSHRLGGWKPFKAGLRVRSENLADGEIIFDVRFLDADRDQEEELTEARQASSDDHSVITWVVNMSDEAERAIIERHRSERMQQRGARTQDEEALLRHEAQRLREANRQLKAALERALCQGKIFVGGKERSPGDDASDPKVEAKRVLGPALEAAFHRFDQGGVKVQASDVKAVVTNESLAGLPECMADLVLVETAGGQNKLVTDRGIAEVVMSEVKARGGEGRAMSGKELEKTFSNAPYGWPFEVIQLIVAVLLREGKVSLLSEGSPIRSPFTIEARKALTNNTAFRATTIHKRESGPSTKQRQQAARILEDEFGHRCQALTPDGIASVIREQLCTKEGMIDGVRQTLRDHSLAGDEVLARALDTLRVIRQGDDEEAISLFLENADTLSTALKRTTQLQDVLTEQCQADLRQARGVLNLLEPVLPSELEEGQPALKALAELKGHLSRETFFEHLPAILAARNTVIDAFSELYDAAFKAHRDAYTLALQQLENAPGWKEISEEDRESLSETLRNRARLQPSAEPWREAASALRVLRAQAEAAPMLLAGAIESLLKILNPKAVTVRVRDLLTAAITSPDDLETAITTIREAVEAHLADGRPVVLE